MGKSSNLRESAKYRIEKSEKFEEEARQLFGTDSNSAILAALDWALSRKPFFGQLVKDSDKRAWSVRDSGYAFIAYYRILGDVVFLDSLIRRALPVSPKALGLEE